MERITRKHLSALVAVLNDVTGSPAEPYTKQEDGTYKTNIGNYHLSGAYGGWCVHRMMNDGGGVDTPIAYGHIPARDLYERIHAYLKGFRAGQDHIKSTFSL